MIPLGDLGGNTVILSRDFWDALLQAGRIKPYRRTYAKRLPKARPTALRPTQCQRPSGITPTQVKKTKKKPERLQGPRVKQTRNPRGSLPTARERVVHPAPALVDRRAVATSSRALGGARRDTRFFAVRE